MAFRIYTKKGDQGETSLLGGTRVSKSSLRIETYGTIDTFNSYLGWAGDYQKEEAVIALVREIQDRLFTIGSLLATDPNKEVKMRLPSLETEDITRLENAIDEINAQVSPYAFFYSPRWRFSHLCLPYRTLPLSRGRTHVCCSC